MLQQFAITTRRRTELVDITGQVEDLLREARVDRGVCYVYVPHTTAAVTVNENADPSVPQDILMELDKMVPFDESYRHREGNSPAHIKSTVVGCSEVVLIEAGRLVLGTWQGVFFCEFDGPRTRRVIVKVVPDSVIASA